MRDTSDKGETPIYLHDMTDEELVRHVTGLPVVTPLENELAQRLEIVITTVGGTAGEDIL
jgi:hypothetical protein